MGALPVFTGRHVSQSFSKPHRGAPRDRFPGEHNGQLSVPNRVGTAGAPPGESGRAWGRGLVPAFCGRGLVPASCGRGLVPAQRRGRWPEARSAAPRELYIFLGEQDLWLVTKLHVTGPKWLGDSKFYSYYLYRWVGGWVGSYRNTYRIEKKTLTEVLEANRGGCDFVVTLGAPGMHSRLMSQSLPTPPDT